MSEERSELAAELADACRHPLDRVFLGSSVQVHLEKYCRLAAEVERIRPLDWDLVPAAALIKVVRDAANVLDGSDDPTFFPGSWGDLARIVVGAADPPGEVLTYNQRLAVVRERFTEFMSRDDEQDMRNGQLWPMLAQALTELPAQQARPVAPAGGRLPGEVDRSVLYRDARWALRGPARVTVLWGESGNGKSYLARQLLRDEFAGRRVAILREDDGTPSLFDRDLIDLLQARGEPAEQWNSTARELALRDALLNPESFDVVFFDNVLPGRFDDLFQTSAVQVLVTARQQLSIDDAEHVLVPEYQPDEAALAAERSFPPDTEGDIAAFCADVGYRPIVIDLTSRLLQLGNTTLNQIRSAVELNAEVALDAVYSYLGGYTTQFGETVSSTVVEIYRRLWILLESMANAAAVLDVLLWLPRLPVREYIVALAADPAEGIDELMADGGFTHLARLGVIDLRGGGVVMNDLTRSLLRAISADRMAPTARRFLQRCVKEPLPNNFRELMNQDRDPGSLLRRVRAIDSSPRDELWMQYAANFYLSRCAMRILAPGRLAGVYQIAPREYLAWQRDFALFREPADGDGEYAFIEMTPLRGIVTTQQGQRQELEVEFALNVHKYALIYNAALRQPGLYQDEPTWGYGAEFWLTPDDGFRHELITALPSLIAATHKIPIWATCGKLFVPDEHPDPSAIPPCPRCAAFASSNADPFTSDTLDDIAAFWWALDRDRANWSILARIYNAQVVLSWESGHGIFESPVDVLATEAAIRADVTLYVPWIYAAYAAFLLQDEDKQATEEIRSAALTSLENAVTALQLGGSLLSEIDVLCLLLLLAETAALAGDIEWSDSLLENAETRLPGDESGVSRALREQAQRLRHLISSYE